MQLLLTVRDHAMDSVLKAVSTVSPGRFAKLLVRRIHLNKPRELFRVFPSCHIKYGPSLDDSDLQVRDNPPLRSELLSIGR